MAGRLVAMIAGMALGIFIVLFMLITGDPKYFEYGIEKYSAGSQVKVWQSIKADEEHPGYITAYSPTSNLKDYRIGLSPIELTPGTYIVATDDKGEKYFAPLPPNPNPTEVSKEN
jgi:hypothetical protein